jgi:hypothetical protein
MSAESEHTRSWPELGIALYDKLTGRDAEISYEFHDLEVMVPSAARPDASHAPWKLNGTVKIRTRNCAESA